MALPYPNGTYRTPAPRQSSVPGRGSIPRPLPVGANDNRIGSVKARLATVPKAPVNPAAFYNGGRAFGNKIMSPVVSLGLRPAVVFGGIARVGLRLIPVVGAAITIYELISLGAELANRMTGPTGLPEGSPGPGYFSKVGECTAWTKWVGGMRQINSGKALCQTSSGAPMLAIGPVPADATRVTYYQKPVSETYQFYAKVQWVRTTQALATNPQPKPAFGPLLNYSPHPSWVNPFVPPNVRMKVKPTPYVMIPHMQPNPNLSPTEQTLRGQPSLNPNVGYPVFGAPGLIAISPRPVPPYGLPWEGLPPGMPKPGQVIHPPDVVVIAKPGQATQTVARPGAAPKPPRRKDKEKKIISGLKPGTPLAMLIGTVGESLDLINALWKALPKDYKTGYYPLRKRNKETNEIEVYFKWRHRSKQGDRINDLIEHWEHVDGVQAIANVIENQIEDAILGKIGSALQKSRAKAMNDIGVDLGPIGRGQTSGLGLGRAAYQRASEQQRIDAERAERARKGAETKSRGEKYDNDFYRNG